MYSSGHLYRVWHLFKLRITLNRRQGMQLNQHAAPARPSILLQLLAAALTTDRFDTKEVLTSAWGGRDITNANLAVESVGQRTYYTT